MKGSLPFHDLRRQIQSERDRIDTAFDRVLTSGQLLLGSEMAAFEEEFAAWNGVEHVVGVSSGCTAIALLLQAAGIGLGDEVIVPGFTCPATWMGVRMSGAMPVASEVDASTALLDPKGVADAFTSRTKAVIAVHLYGAVCEMDSLRVFCDEQKLWLFVDAAQSTGASYKGSRAAALGDGAAFSFYPTKNLAALDDAGAVATASRELAEAIIAARNYGKDKRGIHQVSGINARMGDLQAAVLRMRLGELGAGNQKRRELAEIYLQELAEIPGIQLPPSSPESAWHLFVVRVTGTMERDALSVALKDSGVGTAVHYREAFSTCPAFEGKCDSIPTSESFANSVLSLPLNPWLDKDEVFEICRRIRDCISFLARR